MGLLAGFATLAVLLAAIGLYGVAVYTVSQRRHELAVRIALGASRRDVIGLVFAAGARTVAAGVLVGVATALGAARALDTLLFGVQAADVRTLAGAVMTLGLVRLLAHWVPARRALRVDPATTLRQE